MPRPEKKVHIPLDFAEALADLLKVQPEPESEPDQNEADDVEDSASGRSHQGPESNEPTEP